MTDDQILDAILRREGGYVNHPADRGGCTNRGITIGVLREWRGRPVTCEDVQNLTELEAREIYTANYVQPFDDVDPALKPQVVDIAVNSGVSRAKTLLAQARLHTRRSVNVQLVIERLQFYARIVKSNPSQAVFLSGWINRACEFLNTAPDEPRHGDMDTGSEIPGGGAS